MVDTPMKPPQGRIEIGWRVRTTDGRRGKVIAERSVTANGAWFYAVVFDNGSHEELPDYSLHRLRSDAAAGTDDADDHRSGSA